jgi:hypothetical protein
MDGLFRGAPFQDGDESMGVYGMSKSWREQIVDEEIMADNVAADIALLADQLGYTIPEAAHLVNHCIAEGYMIYTADGLKITAVGRSYMFFARDWNES